MAHFTDTFLSASDYFYTDHPPVFRIPFPEGNQTYSARPGPARSSREAYAGSVTSRSSLASSRRPHQRRRPSRIFGTTDPHPSRRTGHKQSAVLEESTRDRRGSMSRHSLPPTVASSSTSSIRTTSSKFSSIAIFSPFSSLRQNLAKRIPRPLLTRKDSIVRRPAKKQKIENKYGTSASAMAAAASVKLSQALLIPRTKATPNEPTVYHPISLLHSPKHVQWRRDHEEKIYVPGNTAVPEISLESPSKKRLYSRSAELPRLKIPESSSTDSPFITRIKEVRAQFSPEEQAQFTFVPCSSSTSSEPPSPLTTIRGSVASISTRNSPHVLRQTPSQLRLRSLSESFARVQTKQADLDECVQQETKLKMADEEDESERKSPVPLGWRKLGMHERIIVSEEEIGPDEVSAGCDGNARYPEPESPKIHVLHNSFQGPHDSNKDTSVVHWCDKTSDRLGGNSSCPPSPPPAIATEVSTKLADKSRHRRATAASLNNDFASSPPDMLLPLLANNTGSSSGGSASNQTATTSATTPATELDLDELCGRFEKLRLDGMKEVAKRGTAGQGKAGGKEEEGKEARDVEATVRALKMFLEKLKPDVIQSGGDGEMKEQVWKLLAGVAKTALEILAAGKAVG